MLSLLDILEDVNRRLDAHRLVLKIDYFPEKISISGDRIKCFCPIHGEKAFRSLIVETDKNRYKCTYMKCEGYEGGTLVELYGRVRRIGQAAAATELAADLGIPLDPAVFGGLAEGVARQAVEALERGDAGQAVRLTAQACELAPGDAAMWRLQAQALRAAGRADEAAPMELRAASAFLEQGEDTQALELLEALSEAEPGRPEIASALLDAHLKAGRHEQAGAVLWPAVQKFSKSETPVPAIELLEKWLQAFPADLEALRQSATLLARAGRKADAASHWRRAADEQIRAGEGLAALESITSLEALDKKPQPQRALRAAALAAAGRPADARTEFLALAAEAASRGSMEEADRICDEILRLAPEDEETLDALAGFYEKAGRSAEAGGMRRRLAIAMDKRGAPDGALSEWRRARTLAPNAADIREGLIDLLLRRGETVEALGELEGLADVALEGGDFERCTAVCRRISELAPLDARRRIAAADRLGRAVDAGAARAELADAARAMAAAGRMEGALQISERALQNGPEDGIFLEIRAEASAGLGLLDDGRRAFEAWVAHLLAREDLAGALTVLHRAVAFDPRHLPFLRSLGETAAAAGQMVEAVECHRQLAGALREGGDARGATQALLTLRSLDPADLASLESLSEWAETDGDAESALKHADEWIVAARAAGDVAAERRALGLKTRLRPESLTDWVRLIELQQQAEGGEYAAASARRALDVALRAKDPKHTDSFYRILARLAPSDDASRSAYAEWLLEQGEKERAIEEFRALCRLYSKGKARAEKLAAALARLATLQPDDPALIEERGKAQEAAGSVKEAAGSYQKAAELFQSLGAAGQAIEARRSQLRLEEDDEASRLVLARMLQEEGRAGEAGKELDTLARVALARDDPASAAEHLETWLDLAPGSKGLLERVCAALLAAGRRARESAAHGDAVALAERALARSPGDIAALGCVADWAPDAGDIDRAVAARLELAKLLDEGGRVEEAHAQLRSGAGLQPDSLPIWRRLAEFEQARIGAEPALASSLKVLELARAAGDPGEIAAEYVALMKRYPLRAGIREEYAGFLFDRGDVEGGAQELRALSAVLKKGKDFSGLARTLERLLALRPDDSALLGELAEAEERAGRPEAAAARHRQAGDALRDAGSAAKATVEYRESLRLQPQDEATRERLAETLAEAGKAKEAAVERQILADAARARGDALDETAQVEIWFALQPKAKGLRARLLECVERAAEVERAAGRFEPALRRLAQWRELSPKDLSILERMAGWSEEAGLVAQAGERFEELAAACAREGRLDEAEAASRRKALLNPDSLEEQRRLAEFLREHRGLDAALPVYLKALSMARASGAAEQIEAEYSRLLELCPSDAALRREYAACLLESGRSGEAASQLETAAGLCGNDPDRAGELGAILESLRGLRPYDTELWEREAQARRALGQKDEAYLLLGEAAERHVAADDSVAAARCYRALVELDPKDEASRESLCRLLEAQGLPSEAVIERWALADLARERGSDSGEIAALEALLGLESDNGPARGRLAAVLAGKGRDAEAAAHWSILLTQQTERGAWKEAVETGQKLLHIESEDGESRGMYAKALAETGEISQALAEHRLAAAQLQSKGLVEASEMQLRQGLKLDSGDTLSLEALAALLAERGDIEAARVEFARLAALAENKADWTAETRAWGGILSLKRDDAAALAARSRSLRRQGLAREALDDLITLLGTIAPASDDDAFARALGAARETVADDPALRLRLADSLSSLGRLELAVEDLANAVRAWISRGERRPALDATEAALAWDEDSVAIGELRAETLLAAEDKDAACRQYVRLAVKAQSRREYPAAESAFHRALELRPDDLDALGGVIDCCLESGRKDEAFDGILRLAGEYEKRNEPQRRLAALQRAVKIKPEDVDARSSLAGAWASAGESGKAIAELTGLADQAQSRGENSAAEAWLQEALTIAPDDESLLRRRVELIAATRSLEEAWPEHRKLIENASARNPKKALEEFTELVSRHSDVDFVHRDFARFLAGRGMRSEAAEQWIASAGIVEGRGDYNAALADLKSARQTAPDSLEAEEALAGTVGRVGRRLLDDSAWEEALATVDGAGLPPSVGRLELALEALLALRRTDDAFLKFEELAQLHVSEGDFDRSGEAWRRAVEALQGDPRAWRGRAEHLVSRSKTQEAADAFESLGEEQRKRGENAEAIEAFEQAASLAPSRIAPRLAAAGLLASEAPAAAIGRYLEAAQLQLQAGGAAEAVQTLLKAVALKPDDTHSLKRLLGAAGRAGDRKRVASTAHELARRFISQDNPEEAILAYRDAVEWAPDDESLLDALGRLYESQGLAEEAVSLLERRAGAAESAGRKNEARRLYAEAAESSLEDPEAQGRFAEALLRLGSTDEAVKRLHRRADIFRGRGRFDESVATLERALAISPSDTHVRVRLAEGLEARGDLESAAGHYAAIAMEKEREGRTDDALKARRRMAEIQPENLANLQILADSLLARGDRDEAFGRFAHLAELHELRGEMQEAIRSCSRMLECGVDEIDARRRMIRAQEKGGDDRAAAAEVERLVGTLVRSGNWTEAEGEIRRGLELDSERLSLAVQYVRLLESQKRDEEAHEFLPRLAECALRSPDPGEAVEILEAHQDQAEAPTRLHEALIDIYGREGDAGKLAGARLRLADRLLFQGSIEEAKTQCEKAVAAGGGNRGTRVSVAQLFEKHQIPELAADEYRSLAQELMARGEPEEAAPLAEAGLRLRPRHLGLRGILIDALTAMKRVEEAYKQRGLLVEAAVEAGALDIAESALRSMLAGKSDDPEPRRQLVALLGESGKKEECADILVELAALLEERGDVDGAVQSYRELLTLRPQDVRSRARYIELYSGIGNEQDLVQDYIILAQQRAAEGAVLEAIRAFERAIHIDPGHIEGRKIFLQFLRAQGQRTRMVSESLELGKALSARGDYRAASRLLQEALQMAPRDKDLLAAASDAYARLHVTGQAIDALRRLLDIQSEEADRRGQIETIERILALDPADGEARQQQIALLRREGSPREAADHAIVLAEQYAARGLHDFAEHVYRELLHHDPENVNVWQRMIETHMKIGIEEDLLSDYTILGDLLARQGQLREACRIYKRIIELDPDQIEIRRKHIDTHLQIGLEQELIEEYMELADRLLARKDIEQALEVYGRVMKLSPGHRGARARLSETQQMIANARGLVAEGSTVGGRPPKAKDIPAPARRREDAVSETKFGTRGMASREALEKTVRVYENLLRINPANAPARTKLAEAFEQLGRADDAARQWDLACDGYMQSGDYGKAIQICERILERDSSNLRARDRLSKAIVQRASLREIDSALSEFIDEDSGKGKKSKGG